MSIGSYISQRHLKGSRWISRVRVNILLYSIIPFLKFLPNLMSMNILQQLLLFIYRGDPIIIISWLFLICILMFQNWPTLAWMHVIGPTFRALLNRLGYDTDRCEWKYNIGWLKATLCKKQFETILTIYIETSVGKFRVGSGERVRYWFSGWQRSRTARCHRAG